MMRNIPTSTSWPALGSALLALTLAGCGGNTASTDTASPDSANSPSTKTATTTTSAPANSSPPVSGAASFAGAAAQWKQIEAAKASLDKVIAAKELAKVHEAAFKVRDLAKALPAQSLALPAAKQQTLGSQVKNVAQLAALLDEAGDAGKLKETQENQAGLGDALDIIKGLYPAGALS